MYRRTPKIAVIGAGIGGIVSAIDLARAGCDVVVLERAARAGGKMRTIGVGDSEVDAGPTVLTMRWVFDELFQGEIDRHVKLEPMDVIARHAWSDGTQLDLFADRARSKAAIEKVFGRREAEGYELFLGDTRRIYDTVLQPFLRSQRPTTMSIVKSLGAFTRIDAFRTMWAAIGERFSSLHLRQLFGRYATYCGSSPFEAPATLNLIAAVEAMGVHKVVGGMGALRQALLNFATAKGVRIRYGCDVAKILVDGGGVRGALTTAGERIDADSVVFNGDVSALGDLLGRPKPTAPEDRSLSAVTFALVGTSEGLPLVHHNVMFSDDYVAEFRALHRREFPVNPTVYLCAQGEGRMLLVVNAPANGDDPTRWTESERKRCEEMTFATMRRCGLTLTPRVMVQTTPAEFAAMFPGSGGALYGPASRGPWSALSRQAARSKITGLYLAGGSVHPGPGVPMAAISGRLAAAALSADLASTSTFRTVATHGTTWTA